MVSVLEADFFLSEILGRGVFLRQQRIGRLGDLGIIETGRLPAVSHLIVKRPYGYPALTVPWDKVLMISNTEVVLDLGSEVSAAYERPPPDGVVLLHDHILDKKILDMDDHEVEVAYDVRLVFQSGTLYASEVDFSHYRALRRLGLRWLARMLTRRSDEARVSWLYVQPLHGTVDSFTGNVKLKVSKQALADIHPVDLADILEELDRPQRVALFNELEPEQATETLEEVEPRVQRELIGALPRDRAARLVNEMTPAQAADLLAILPKTEADQLLTLIDRDTSTFVEQIISEHDEQIGHYATRNLIELPVTARAGDVLRDYRELAKSKDVTMYVYVTGAGEVLRGVVDLRELLAAEPGQQLGELMTEHVISLRPEASVGDAAELFERYDFRALPIVDAGERLIGAISSRDMRSIKSRRR
ncbi:MAG: magnesium transporter [Proteobacteria bacterium]|nr:magnesium transporter [Pseudomonadota bacterium]